MKKIMIMTNGLYGGGAEKILQTIISHINYKKYDITLYSLHKEKIDPKQYKGPFHYKYVFGENSPLVDKIKGWIFNNCPAGLFYFLFIRGKYDVEIAFIEGESTKIISGSTNLKSKKLAWVHIDLKTNPWTAFLYKNVDEEKKHYRKFDKIVCVSDAVRDAFIEKFEIEEERVSTQYNPVDCKKIVELSKKQSGLKIKKCIRMIAVGRLVPQKGFDRLLRVVNRLKTDGYEFELVIVGEGQEHEQLQQYIDVNHLGKQVTLLGYKENPYCYMMDSDLLVCSSRAEGFSTVLTEGIILGLPIVSTECAGVKELFGDFECGKIVDNDEEELYHALSNVLKDNSCLKEYKKAALERSKTFSLEKRMEDLEKLFL